MHDVVDYVEDHHAPALLNATNPQSGGTRAILLDVSTTTTTEAGRELDCASLEQACQNDFGPGWAPMKFEDLINFDPAELDQALDALHVAAHNSAYQVDTALHLAMRATYGRDPYLKYNDCTISTTQVQRRGDYKFFVRADEHGNAPPGLSPILQMLNASDGTTPIGFLSADSADMRVLCYAPAAFHNSQDACDETGVYHAPCSCDPPEHRVPLGNFWTDWVNVDNPSGLGDFEGNIGNI